MRLNLNPVYYWHIVNPHSASSKQEFALFTVLLSSSFNMSIFFYLDLTKVLLVSAVISEKQFAYTCVAQQLSYTIISISSLGAMQSMNFRVIITKIGQMNAILRL